MYPRFIVMRIILPDGTESKAMVVLTTSHEEAAFSERLAHSRTQLESQGGRVELEDVPEDDDLIYIVNMKTAISLRNQLSQNLN